MCVHILLYLKEVNCGFRMEFVYGEADLHSIISKVHKITSYNTNVVKFAKVNSAGKPFNGAQTAASKYVSINELTRSFVSKAAFGMHHPNGLISHFTRCYLLFLWFCLWCAMDTSLLFQFDLIVSNDQ